MDNSALPPETFSLDAEPIQAFEEQAVSVAQEEDKEYAALLGMKGWQRITTDMQTDIDKLRNLTGVKLAGLSREEVGDKFLISSLVADHLQKYLDKVTNAAKAVADANRASEPK